MDNATMEYLRGVLRGDVESLKSYVQCPTSLYFLKGRVSFAFISGVISSVVYDNYNEIINKKLSDYKTQVIEQLNNTTNYETFIMCAYAEGVTDILLSYGIISVNEYKLLKNDILSRLESPPEDYEE